MSPVTKKNLNKLSSNKDITAAWAGGYKGREVVYKLIPNIRTMLSKDGIFIILLIEENGIYQIVQDIIDTNNQHIKEDERLMCFQFLMKRE